MKTILSLTKAAPVEQRIDNYFIYIQGEYHLEKNPVKTTKNETENIEVKVWDREPEPPTFSGLALALGFNSLKEFEDYETKGRFNKIVKRARLRIETIYESRLHQNATGAMFALKSMGWNEKPEDAILPNEGAGSLKVEITNTGPSPAGSEKEVEL